MILLILASSIIPSGHHCTAEEIHEQIMEEKYALMEEYYDDFDIERDFELLEGYYPWLNQDTSPNLQHLRGSRTRWQKGVASWFG